MMELDVIFAVIVGGGIMGGGRFTLGGALVGAIILRTLTETMYAYGVPPARAPLFKALVLIVICLFQSQKMRDQFSSLFPRRKSA